MIKYLKNKRNLWDSSHNSKTLASYLALESLRTSVHKGRRVCSAAISSQSCVNRRELRARTLMWLIMLSTSCKTMLSSGDVFRLASISLWMTQCIDSHSEVTSWTRVVKPESHPVTAATPSMHIVTRNDQFSFPDMQSFKDLNSSAAVVLVGNKSAYNIPSCTSSSKLYHIKISIVALLSTSVDLSTWIVYHGDSLILSDDFASVSYAISSIRVVMVPAERGTRATF